MKTGYKVCDAMTERPIIVKPSTTLQECAKIMQENHIGSLVVKDNHKPKGILTEQDIVRKAVIFGGNVGDITVEKIMETNLMTISPEKDIFEALILMRDYNIRHLPVMDEEKMIGFVTSKDILKMAPDMFNILMEKYDIGR